MARVRGCGVLIIVVVLRKIISLLSRFFLPTMIHRLAIRLVV